MKRSLVLLVVFVAFLAGVVSSALGADAKVTVGTRTGLTPQNVQSETAVAVDAHAPQVLAAGANEFGDWSPCPRSGATQRGNCRPLFGGIGISGVYFSFDAGRHWMQPVYTGWTGYDCASGDSCTGHFGPIHTLPWYAENTLASSGDPALAFGPVPRDGQFSWSNGSRLYYANLVSKPPAFPNTGDDFKGFLGVAVSRLDNATPERVALKSSWMPPVIASVRNSVASGSDKEQIWADNAGSSPFFGNVYVCNADYRSLSQGQAFALTINVAISRDGGGTWTVRQASNAATNVARGFHQGCSVRTDSHGVVYLMYTQFGIGLPGIGSHVLQKSYDGGRSWTPPRAVLTMNDACYQFDPIEGRCVMDGYAGARIDLSAGPSFDIANGAPTGVDASDEIVDAWSDGGFGFNSEKTLVSWSIDGGATWHEPVVASGPSERSMYSAPAISPDGTAVYLVYEALGEPWRGADMFAGRPYRGVFRQASVDGNGNLGAWSTLYTGPWGDIRGSYPGHDLYQERVGDYVYAAATRSYGTGVWTDARDAPVCTKIQQWRQDSYNAGSLVLPGAPWPLSDCQADWGNIDIWSATTG
jgi:hypothetical protein